MKNLFLIIVIFLGFLFSSCEKVIDVDLAGEPPRLVIDAALTWVKGTDGKNQSITLSTTGDYFDTEIPKVSGAIVYVNNTANAKFDFIEESTQKGKYTCTNFNPVIGETYTLTVISNGETYKGQEKLTSVNEILDVEQRDDFGVNKDEYAIRVNFPDVPNQNNFYVMSYKSPASVYPIFEVFDDQFFEGNETFGLFSDDKLKKGDAIEIKLAQTSERYFNYMKILTSTAAGGGGGPFRPSPASTIRGNMVNQTNPKNFCLGYFAVNEADKLLYILK
ncbi:DUF4249 family protein [Pedobacter alpinus]|uniref:DUF4249 family protein n=1 Tax=Pedobacter alpinus TaxID=1590643 RepID=A0ABW5TW96_9SPHI